MTSQTIPRAGSSAGLDVAVVDGPDGTRACRAPEERAEALRLQRLYEHRFWCSTAAVGGCGGRLRLHAGEVVRPYFQHVADARACALAREPSRAERSYEHLWFQHELIAWLAGQGLEGKPEHVMGDNGRADVHVVVDEVLHSIEVQLSPLEGQRWAERDKQYRQSMDCVTWLYGGEAEPAAAREQALRGIALVLTRDAGGVRVGVLSHSGPAWSPLTDCRLDSDHLWTPHLEAAQAEHRKWEQDRERAAELARKRAVQAQEARERAARERAARERARRAAADEQWAQAPPRPSRDPADRWPGTAARWQATFPEAEEWITAQDWRWLDDVDDAGRPLVQLVTYLTQCIYFNGPTAMFDLPDVPDAEAVLDRLRRRGLIQRSERSGVQRWQRAGRA